MCYRRKDKLILELRLISRPLTNNGWKNSIVEMIDALSPTSFRPGILDDCTKRQTRVILPTGCLSRFNTGSYYIPAILFATVCFSERGSVQTYRKTQLHPEELICTVPVCSGSYGLHMVKQLSITHTQYW